IDAIGEIERTLGEGDRQLLVFDTQSGEEMKAAIAKGNVDTANHVAVFTPGKDSNVQDGIYEYDKSISKLRDESLKQLNDAHRGNETVATVTWLGYESPQNWGDVALPDQAIAGSGPLSSFLNGIDASRTDDPHLTALGHSYGSLTTSEALQRGTGVDDVVFFGSPGLEAHSSDANSFTPTRDLHVPAGHIFLEKNYDDTGVGSFAAHTGNFGPNPDGLAGIDRISTDAGMTSTLDGSPGDYRSRSAEHSGYLTDQSMGQYNMAVILAGLPELIVQ
ncbi:MAG: alpha/beta hydrolase, partial [Mycobacteriaceae bacterium]